MKFRDRLRKLRELAHKGRSLFRAEASRLRCYSVRIRVGPRLMAAKRPYREETSMKELIRQYLDDGVSRRQLMTGLSALGMSTAAATAMAQSLSPVSAGPPNGGRNAVRDVQGTGGRCSWRSSKPRA